jgi:hypothetical protein
MSRYHVCTYLGEVCVEEEGQPSETEAHRKSPRARSSGERAATAAMA